MKARRWPIALTIAGSDSGGGAGIQADLKTFLALRVHGTSAITCITAQNPGAVGAIVPLATAAVEGQLEAILSGLPPDAVKVGMLFRKDICEVVSAFLAGIGRPVVVDPVMVSTSGTRLIQAGALRVARKKLFPAAALLTPNLHEAGILLQTRVRTAVQARSAARQIHGAFGCAALVKGGHLKGSTSVDFYCDGRTEHEFSAPFIADRRLHGTGCALSAAITAWLARGHSLIDAIDRSKQYISQAIRQIGVAGRNQILNHTPWEGESPREPRKRTKGRNRR